ncbi:MAG: hypothetical protein AAFY08_11085 [Planctomycetota bacterium]
MSDALRDHLAAGRKAWVSITGLTLKRPWSIVPFLWYAIPSKMQADKAPGMLRADVREIAGVRHTLTVWRSRGDMLAYIHSGHHKRAIAAFSRFFDGTTYGYETADIPDWGRARALWEQNGRPYTPPRRRVAADRT